LLGVTTTRKDNNGPAGATITDVAAGSAADKAGLKIGDIITKVDEIGIANPGDLVNAIRKYDPREKATITYLRDGKEQKVTLTLGENKDAEVFQFNGPDGSDYQKEYGMDENFFKQLLPPGYNYNFDNKNSPKLGIRAQDTEDGKGAKVLYVDGQSEAARAGIREQDIITTFDGHPVTDATSLAALARESHLKPSVKVNVLRDGKPLELEIKNPRRLKTADL
jgi:serine protease Do